MERKSTKSSRVPHKSLALNLLSKFRAIINERIRILVRGKVVINNLYYSSWWKWRGRGCVVFVEPQLTVVRFVNS